MIGVQGGWINHFSKRTERSKIGTENGERKSEVKEIATADHWPLDIEQRNINLSDNNATQHNTLIVLWKCKYLCVTRSKLGH